MTKAETINKLAETLDTFDYGVNFEAYKWSPMEGVFKDLIELMKAFLGVIQESNDGTN